MLMIAPIRLGTLRVVWKTEVQDLIRDVSGFEKEFAIREFFSKAGAKQFIVNCSRTVFRLEGDQNVSIAIAEHRIIPKGQVDTAVRHTDVVEDHVQFFRRYHLANFVVHSGEILLGMFDASAGRCENMKADLP